ncbi:Anamorsin-like protein 2, partial [Rhizoctonia solani]
MDDRSILVLYGTETGNAKDASEKIGRCYQSELRRQPTLIDEPLVIFVCSTTGNGVEPANMTTLWNALLRAELPPDLFEDMKFAVLGLGDSSYQRFNWAAKRLQRRLLSLGGYELCERGDADDQHPQGRLTGLDILPETNLYPPAINMTPWNSDFGAEESIATSLVASESFYTMKLTKNTRMTDPSWYQDVRHLIFQTDKDIQYQPGDIAILHPENSPEDVETLLKRLGWEDDADEPIRITPNSEDRSLPLGYPRPDTPTTLRSLITKHADINSVPRKSFIELLVHFTKDKMETEKLQEFCTPEGLDDLFDYTTRVRRTILEVLLEFRSAVVPKEYIADLFPELRPRQFSIASSLSAHPSEIHLCVAIVNYRTKLRVPRKGVCTSWLARLEAGVALDVGLKRGTMELPKDDQKPIILVGPGTGVAPMRAMIEERVAKGATAASRDQVGQALLHSPSALLTTSKKERKIYVQELITHDSKEVKERLVDRKGSLYISGYDDFLEFKYAGS